MKVFNVTLKERREIFDIKADLSMFDSPAWIRQGKTIRFWIESDNTFGIEEQRKTMAHGQDDLLLEMEYKKPVATK